MPLFELDDVFTYQDANDIKRLWPGATPPDLPGDEEVWLDTSQEPFRLKRYDKTADTWSVIGGMTKDEILALISGSGIGLDADTLDGVEGAGYIRREVDQVVTANTQWDDGFQAAFGDGNRMTISHTGTEANIFNQVGDLVIHQMTHGCNLNLKAENDAGSVLNLMVLDPDLSNGSVTMPNPTGSLFIGANNDLRLHHDTTNAYIENENSGDLYIWNRSDGGDMILKCEDASGVEKNMLVLDPDAEEATILGNKVWHEGNDGSESGLDADKLDGVQASQFLRSDTADTATARIIFSGGDHTIDASDSHGALEITGPDDLTPAIMAFRRPGAYASYFGLDTDNHWKVGGWSAGTNKYKLWHEGNDGTGSGLNADLLQGAAPVVDPTGSTIVKRHANGYVYASYFNSSSGASTNPTHLYGSEDNFIRKVTPSQLIAFIADVDGTGSGLDADTVDNIQASQFVRSDTADNVTSSTEWQDNCSVRFGNDADFRIWHDGTDTVLRSYNHGSNVYIQAEDAAGTNKTYLRINPSSGVVEGSIGRSALVDLCVDAVNGTVTNPIIQTGDKVLVDRNTPRSYITFPVAFTTAPRIFFNVKSEVAATVINQTISTTGIFLQHSSAGTTYHTHWTAIGPAAV